MSNFAWTPGVQLKNMEDIFVADALKFYQGNKQSAANALGIELAKLEEILKRTTLNAEAQAKADAERAKKSADFLARSRGIATFDQKTGADTISPYVQAEGFDSLDAASLLAQTSPAAGQVTPESAVPAVSMLPNAGDPVAAALKTKELIEQAALAEPNFPKD